MLSFLTPLFSFFSMHSKSSWLGLLTGVIIAAGTAFFIDRKEIYEAISSVQDKVLVLDHGQFVLVGKVNVLESDSKSHVTQSSFSHYIDHADTERDTQAEIDRINQKEFGALIKGQQDIERQIYNGEISKTTKEDILK